MLALACCALEQTRLLDAARQAISRTYSIRQEDEARGFVATEWAPRYDELENVHYRLRVEARVQDDRVEVLVPRETKDFISGAWVPGGQDEEERARLTKSIQRARRAR